MKRMLSLCLGVALLLTGGLSHADGMDGIPAASPLAHGESVSRMRPLLLLGWK